MSTPLMQSDTRNTHMYWRMRAAPCSLEVINVAIDRVFVCAAVMLCGLESLLEAGRQVLLEAIECQPQVIILLPRELNPNKKYSWRQKKDEPVCLPFYYSLFSSPSYKPVLKKFFTLLMF